MVHGDPVVKVSRSLGVYDECLYSWIKTFSKPIAQQEIEADPGGYAVNLAETANNLIEKQWPIEDIAAIFNDLQISSIALDARTALI